VGNDCKYLLRAVFFSSTLIGGMTGNRTVILRGRVSCLARGFASGVLSVDGKGDGKGFSSTDADEESGVWRVGAFSTGSVVSSEGKLPRPPKKPFSFPTI
jgi:hypothetical protein